MVRSISVAAFCAAVFATGCTAPEVSLAETVPVDGVSERWPDYTTQDEGQAFTPDGIAALEARMAQFVENGQSKGITTLLLKDGQVVSHIQAGIRRASDGAPLAEDTIYRLYSMSKPIAAVALFILYEEGAFELDDPVTNFIPEFDNLQVYVEGQAPAPVSRPPTMAELMSHTAGFAYGLSDVTPPDASLRAAAVLYQPDFQSFIDIVAATPLLRKPGEDWYYSVASDIKGVIIERISGQTFEAFLETRLFGPLGMDDTGFVVPEADYDRFSDVWAWNAETEAYQTVTAPWALFKSETVGLRSGGGGMVSTLDDYARFTQMLLNEGAFGDIRILKPATVNLLTTNVLREDQSIFTDGTMGPSIDGMGFGLGVGTIDGPPATDRGYGAGTHYWGGAAGTWYWIDPEHDLIFIGMIQRFRAGAPPVDFRAISAQQVYDAMVGDE
ncbi:MAG: serine hydrolase domain-containing protein [Pseudomonadota bacterium]